MLQNLLKNSSATACPNPREPSLKYNPQVEV